MQTFLELVKSAIGRGADELFILAGQPVMFKTGAEYAKLDDNFLMPEDTAKLIGQAYDIARRPTDILTKNRDDQFALSLPGISRIRVTSYFQRSSHAMTARIIPFNIPEPEDIHIPAEVMELSELKDGLVLFCGPSGCGKSTSAVCLINAINKTRCCHILTLESPIEYLFKNKTAFVSQRELMLDTADMEAGLLSSRRISPDVLFFSDIKTGRAFTEGLEKAENGGLVVGVMSAGSPVSAVLSMLGRYSGDERRQTAQLFGEVLSAIVFETLVPDAEWGMRPVFNIIRPDEKLRRAIGTDNAEEIRRALS